VYTVVRYSKAYNPKFYIKSKHKEKNSKENEI
jgi:hypothetical protein